MRALLPLLVFFVIAFRAAGPVAAAAPDTIAVLPRAQVGDARLITVARLIAGAARREGDLAARYGGEEFALLLPTRPSKMRSQSPKPCASESHSKQSRAIAALPAAADAALYAAGRLRSLLPRNVFWMKLPAFCV